jgi:hypothetical protein
VNKRTNEYKDDIPREWQHRGRRGHHGDVAVPPCSASKACVHTYVGVQECVCVHSSVGVRACVPAKRRSASEGVSMPQTYGHAGAQARPSMRRRVWACGRGMCEGALRVGMQARGRRRRRGQACCHRYHHYGRGTTVIAPSPSRRWGWEQFEKGDYTRRKSDYIIWPLQKKLHFASLYGHLRKFVTLRNQGLVGFMAYVKVLVPGDACLSGWEGEVDACRRFYVSSPLPEEDEFCLVWFRFEPGAC